MGTSRRGILKGGIAFLGGLVAAGSGRSPFGRSTARAAESRDAKHAGEIEIESFSWGLSNSGSTHAGGGVGAGKAAFQDFSFLSRISSVSPRLMVSCATGEHFKQAVLTSRKAGDKTNEYYTIKLSDVLVSSYQQSGEAGDALPSDSFSLNFASIEVSYLQQDPKTGLGSPIKGSYDLRTNKGS